MSEAERTYSLATKITRFFFQNWIKTNRKKIVFHDESEKEKYGLGGIDIFLLIHKQKKGENPEISGLYTKYSESDKEVKIELWANKEPEFYETIYHNMHEYLVHELNHAIQDAQGALYGFPWDESNDPKILLKISEKAFHLFKFLASKMTDQEEIKNLLHKFIYYSEPAEIEAFSRGLFRNAQKLRKPFYELLEEFLDDLYDTLVNEFEEISHQYPQQLQEYVDIVESKILAYVKTYLPSAQLR